MSSKRYADILKLITFLFFSSCVCSSDSEIEKTYYDSGAVYEEISNQKGVLHGAYTAYHDNGNLKIRANYQDGFIEGVKRVYTSDGRLESACEYEKGLGHGECLFYDSTGKLASKFFVSDDKKKGIQTDYFPNGLVKLSAFNIAGEGYYIETFDKSGKSLSDFRSFRVSISDTAQIDSEAHTKIKMFGPVYDDLKIYAIMSKMILIELPEEAQLIEFDENGEGEFTFHSAFDDRKFGYLHLFVIRGDEWSEEFSNIYRKEISFAELEKSVDI